jgi:hypothetical protein
VLIEPELTHLSPIRETIVTRELVEAFPGPDLLVDDILTGNLDLAALAFECDFDVCRRRATGDADRLALLRSHSGLELHAIANAGVPAPTDRSDCLALRSNIRVFDAERIADWLAQAFPDRIDESLLEAVGDHCLLHDRDVAPVACHVKMVLPAGQATMQKPGITKGTLRPRPCEATFLHARLELERGVEDFRGPGHVEAVSHCEGLRTARLASIA